MDHPLAFFALRYLLLWQQTECDLHNQFQQTPSPSALRKALHNFRVARSFTGIDNPGNASRIIIALENVGADTSLSPEAMVEQLTARFAVDFGSSNRSAATKLLWLKYQSPFKMFDTRACRALRNHFNHKRVTRSYPDYVAAWNSSYDSHKAQVLAAADSLSAVQPFFTAWHTVPSLHALVHSPWFLERVFDIYLWELGKPA